MPRNAARLRWVLGLTGVAVVVLLAVTGYEALQARESLQVTAAKFEQVADDLKAGDTGSAQGNLRVAQEAAADAKEDTQGPGWVLSSHLPGIGDDVQAVRTVADVTHVLAADVLPDVVVASRKLSPERLSPRAGRIALRPLREVAPALVDADQELQRQTDRVLALQTEDLNDQLAGPVELMQEKLGSAASLSSKVSYAVRLLPSMLGADGKRTYLMMFQNNAEVRATGGIPGAFATVTVDGGRIRLDEQASASDLGPHGKPVLPVTAEERALYENKLAVFPQNVNMTPDFPRSAELVRAMWKRSTGATVDGVVSVDPVTLSYMLEGTGPVRLPTGARLTSHNAVPLLLNQVYERITDPKKQDMFFAAAARGVFDRLASGAGDPAIVLDGLSRAATEGRVHVWSAHEEEQSLLAETGLGGRIPRRAAETHPFIGVFLNDGTGAKMQYYLDHRVDVESVSCNAEGRQQLTVTVTLRSSAPLVPTRLPAYVVGMARDLGVRPGSMRFNVNLYAPVGGWIDDAVVDGRDAAVNNLEHIGHPVASQTVELAPGQQRRLTYTVKTARGQHGEADLHVTPGVRSSGVGKVEPSSCTNS